MFAGAFNKGLRGALPFLAGFWILGAILALFAQKGIESNNYPNLFYNYFTSKIENRVFIVGLNYIFLAAGVFLMSLISSDQEIVEKQNYFPVFLYMLLCISAIQPDQITPQVFTNVFILYALYKLFDIYRKESALEHIFSAAFWLCISAYITISSIISFPLFFISLLILRPFNWREFTVALLGFAAPVFIYECVAYLTDFNQWYLGSAIAIYFTNLNVPSFSEYYLPILFLLVLMLAISIISAIINGFGNTVKKQKSKYILLWYIFLASLGFFSDGATSSRIILTYAFPLSFFIGDFLFTIKQKKITNTILVILLAGIALIFLAQYDVI